MELNYALHETLDMHEIAAFKAVCATKAKASQLLVSDPALKALLQAEAETSTRHLQELRDLLAGALKGDQT